MVRISDTDLTDSACATRNDMFVFLKKMTFCHVSRVISCMFNVCIFSSPEHEVLKVSYCNRLLSVVRRQHLLVNTLGATFCI